MRATCHDCGCPLVQSEVVNLTGAFCYCSVGWVRTIFETLLRMPVEVELEKAIGFETTYVNTTSTLYDSHYVKWWW